MVEMGSFANYNVGCDLLSNLSVADVNILLTSGLVIYCDDDNLIIGNVEALLKYTEAVGAV
jgi:hypothetical protein